MLFFKTGFKQWEGRGGNDKDSLWLHNSFLGGSPCPTAMAYIQWTKHVGSETGSPVFKHWPYNLLAMWSQASH